MQLNKEQHQAVDHFKGVCIVTATPGSGKTATLTARVIDLIQKQDIPPANILCLTFTNKAANEMRERIASRIGVLSNSIWISTFHSLCLAILRKYGTHVGLEPGFSIYAEKEQKELFQKIAVVQEFDASPQSISNLMKIANDFREDIEDFDKAMNRVSVGERAVISEYMEALGEFNAVDFSGLLYKTWILLKKKPKATAVLANKFQYLLVDEMQDTNSIQYEIIRMIADPASSRQGNLFVVGDPSQSIFGWRGAKPENIQKVKSDFDEVNEVTLPRNYRSTSNILKAAQSLIRHNKDASDVELISERGGGADVSIISHSDPDAESEQIAAMIQAIKAKFGYNFEDFAILYRTNFLSRVPEAKMRKYNLPYKIVGGFSFFERSEIKTALAYMSLLINPSDSISFVRAITSPKRSIGGKVLGRIEALAKEKHISILDACKYHDEIKGLTSTSRKKLIEFVDTIDEHRAKCEDKEPLPDIISSLLQESSYHDFVQEISKKDTKSSMRVENVNELLAGITEFASGKDDASVEDYLRSVQLLTTYDAKPDDDAITLLTMHAAKGLEFPVVFVVGCEEDVVPHKRSIQEGNIEEERRLLYVAITRAKDALIINHCENRRRYNASTRKNYFAPSHPSSFLSEINE